MGTVVAPSRQVIWRLAPLLALIAGCLGPPTPLEGARGAAQTLPDLWVDGEVAGASARVTGRQFEENACELQEGCITTAGRRALLQFDMRTPNTGHGDLDFGNPRNSDRFQYSACHHHFHLMGYAEYRLLDEAGAVVADGHKQAFALMDVEQVDQAAGEGRFHDGDQGISAGWADVYAAGIDCQWIDVTNVAPGAYTLELTVDPDGRIEEEDETNNRVTALVHVDGDSCPDGCAPWDESCCGEEDTCGLGRNGRCDCGKARDWDSIDCASCVNWNPDCRAPEVCADEWCVAGDQRCDEDRECSERSGALRRCSRADDPDCELRDCDEAFGQTGDGFCETGECRNAEGQREWRNEDGDCPCRTRFCESGDAYFACDLGKSCTPEGGSLWTCEEDTDCESNGGGTDGWTCAPEWMDDADCDCGCGQPDPVCIGSGCAGPGCRAEACDYCSDDGFSLGACGEAMPCDCDSFGPGNDYVECCDVDCDHCDPDCASGAPFCDGAPEEPEPEPEPLPGCDCDSWETDPEHPICCDFDCDHCDPDCGLDDSVDC